ncbi:MULTISPECIES: RagB/SusD family nutrient uptake outer membrane protein [Butyricimonas]|uniref:RagB/SusD family nutrient uptake outer membrane protein n=1 Tax=Butyricimonas TaxID=574697 RepID=UPI001D0968F7|nr:MULTISPECIES: RagB/SusD family nutrient uptake outer membrane protein [Butyricimonas]MCB6974327.1 RagB/SusD family nutrient uptake outer membrane protein [Butyricimonas synergistica]MCG4521113.1 RagB/SusD family nutrient uptake outer membrane protein [Butyricimonas sp. DFI.6.44]
MRLRNIIWSGLMLACSVGCADFLDVQPKDKQSEKQLFATRGGYYTAVNGIYNKMASAALYGKNLSYELVDVISKRYQPLSVNTYLTALSTFAYTDNSVETELSNTWTAAYNTILNCNVVLENIDKSEGVLSTVESRVLKGEMLAVRAFLHFDMLRLFGPVYKLQPQAESIPYNESSKVVALPLLPADSVIHEKILRDLDEAEGLLSDSDPVIAEGPMASLEEDQDVYSRYRQLRMNYYAVQALKARVYLYAGEQANALAAARKLLTDTRVDEHFPAVDPNKLLANQTNPDRVFSTEVLAGIYKKDRKDIYTGYFSAEQAGNNYLHPRKDFVNTNLFAGETQDYRFQTWWQIASGVGESGHVLIKYKGIDQPSGTTETEYFYAVFMSLIRLSEVYYIAAECEPVLADRYEWLNQARVRRGLPNLTAVSEDDFMKRLRGEYLREFIGEGQIFFMYKRLYININSDENGYDTSTYGAREERYVLPMPSGEIANR